jgi:hypothetical protein
MIVFDHLSFLEMFLMTVHRNGTPMAELYQMVQQAGNVLARLYVTCSSPCSGGVEVCC